jgi:hypothetical protein
MRARRALMLGLVTIATAAAPTVAAAKEHLGDVEVCGADRCVALRHDAFPEAAAILSHPPFRRSGASVPFYDVMLIWRDENDRVVSHGAVRWAPQLGAARTSGARGPVWSPTSMRLTAALSVATVGLQPRPARFVDDPIDEVGPAARAMQRKLAPFPTLAPPPPRAQDDGGDAAWIVGTALLLLAAAASLSLRGAPLRRRPRSP